MILYSSEKGDTLSSIAEKKLGGKNKASKIADLNNTSESKLKVGDVLFIPASYYKTQPNDTFEKIAQTQLGDESKKTEILLINNVPGGMCKIPDPNSETLKIENFFSSFTPSTTINRSENILQTISQMQLEKAADSLPAGTILLLPVADLPTVIGDCYIEDYQVKEGETLISIAKTKLGSPARKNEIEVLNSLQNTQVKPKQILKLPMDIFRKNIKALVQKIFSNSSSKPRDEQAIQIFVELLLTQDWIEGCYSFMYPDPKNLVTVGLGYNANNLELAQKLPFLICDHPRDAKGNCEEEDHSSAAKATKEDIKKAHAYVSKKGKVDLEKGAVKSDKKSYYDPEKNNLILEKAEIVKLAEVVLKKDYAKVKKDVSNDPISGIVGLLDIVYNAGPAAFPKFNQAVRDSNWIKAALESQRREKVGMGGIRKRNILDYELLMRAAKDAKQL